MIVSAMAGIPVFVIDFIPYHHTVRDGNTTRTSDEWPRIGGSGPNSKNFVLFLLATLVQVSVAKHNRVGDDVLWCFQSYIHPVS